MTKIAETQCSKGINVNKKALKLNSIKALKFFTVAGSGVEPETFGL
jgi:hypothetical protein